MLDGREGRILTFRRQWGAKEAELSKDPEAAKLQEAVHDLPKTMAERIVKEERRRKIVEATRFNDAPYCPLPLTQTPPIQRDGKSISTDISVGW